MLSALRESVILWMILGLLIGLSARWESVRRDAARLWTGGGRWWWHYVLVGVIVLMVWPLGPDAISLVILTSSALAVYFLTGLTLHIVLHLSLRRKVRRGCLIANESLCTRLRKTTSLWMWLHVAMATIVGGATIEETLDAVCPTSHRVVKANEGQGDESN